MYASIPPASRHAAHLNTTLDQLFAAIFCCLWPKLFFDFLTKTLDGAVKPVPVLQILNVLLALVILAYEWPLKWVAGTHLHRSLEARLFVLPLAALGSVLMYQGTNAALYHVLGVGVYFWAFCAGEVSLLDVLRWGE